MLPPLLLVLIFTQFDCMGMGEVSASGFFGGDLGGVPQGLKPPFDFDSYGTAEAVP